MRREVGSSSEVVRRRLRHRHWRRLVARTIFRQAGPTVKMATAHFSVRTLEPGWNSMLSVDGTGAFDLISRESMMQRLLEVERGGTGLPFVRQFYGSRPTHLWEDEGEPCTTSSKARKRRRRSRDTLMLAFYSLGQYRPLVAVQSHFGPTERLFVFLGDVYVVRGPASLRHSRGFSHPTLANSRIQMHQASPSARMLGKAQC